MTGPRNSRQTARGRFYEWDGVEYPSVTTVLSARGKEPGLVNWLAGQPALRAIDDYARLGEIIESQGPKEAKRWLMAATEDAGSRARARGTALHEAIEHNHIPEEDAEAAALYRQFAHWQQAKEVELVAQEFQCWNLQVGYVGTADALARYPDGKLALLDWKTSKAVQMDHLLQITAYLAAEFVGNDGMRDERLTNLLAQCDTAQIVKFAADGWSTYEIGLHPELLSAWVNLVGYTRLGFSHKTTSSLLTSVEHGSADEPLATL